LFKEAIPKLARIAVIYDSANSGDQRLMKEEFPAVARALKFTPQSWEVKTADDFEKVFATVDKQRPDGLDVLGGGGLMNANLKRM
jgi:alpha-L-fucosidase